jgi:hypothetical protein
VTIRCHGCSDCSSQCGHVNDVHMHVHHARSQCTGQQGTRTPRAHCFTPHAPHTTAPYARTASLAVAAEVQPVVCRSHSHFGCVHTSHMPLTMHMHVTHHVPYARTLSDALHNARCRSQRVRTLIAQHTRPALVAMGKKTATPTVTATVTISTYERKRDENIQRNKAVLEQLGLAPDERPTNKVSTVSSHHT